MGEVIPYEVFKQKQREKKYGRRGKFLPIISDEEIRRLCTPEVLLRELEEDEDH